MFAINPEFRKKGEILLRSSRIGNKDCLTAILEEEGALEKKNHAQLNYLLYYPGHIWNSIALEGRLNSVLLQSVLSGESYFFGDKVVQVFFPVTEVLIFTSCQSATGDCLVDLEVQNDNIKGNTTNKGAATVRGKRIKPLLSLALILCSLGISVQPGIHKTQLKTYRRSQECDFAQCSTIEVLISQSREVLLLNTYQIKVGQTCWKRTKGLGKKEKTKTEKTTNFSFPLKLPECISLSLKVCDCALCQSTSQSGGFQEAQV